MSTFSALPDDLPAINELKRIPQWVAWKYEDRGGPKPTKPPMNPHIRGARASSSDPATWGTYEQAETRAREDGIAGVGFVLSEDDNLTGYDFDNCFTRKGRLKPWAFEILSHGETYAEVSPSGKGIRMIARGKINEAAKCDPACVEMYGHGRYLTITGQRLDGAPDTIGPAPKTKAASRARVKLHSDTWAALKRRAPSKTTPPATKVLEFPRQTISAATKDPFWGTVNDAALSNLSAWVPVLLPQARSYRNGYRVASADLGRNYQEDLSILPRGAKDFGVYELGDTRDGKRTPIDLVLEYGREPDAASAAKWLCDRLGLKPESLGWRRGEASSISMNERRAELLSSSAFVRNFTPPDYLIDGILQRRYCYSMTAPTGTGKTSILLHIISRVALGQPVGSRATEAGAVCFLAGENPDDVRSRWMASAQHAGFDVDTIPVYFIEGVFPLADIKGVVTQRAREIGVEFSLVVVDTSAAYDLGDDENSNAQMKKHARVLRSLVELPGGPTVVAACHPAKNADPDNLLPRGGGAFVAEVDGNLVCKKTGEVVELHWQGKFRGVDFDPVPFQIDVVTAEKLRDHKGRQIPTVVAKTISEDEFRSIAAKGRAEEDEVMRLLHDNGNLSISQMAERLHWTIKTGLHFGEPHKTKVVRVLDRLRAEGLAKRERGRHLLTSKGERAIGE